MGLHVHARQEGRIRAVAVRLLLLLGAFGLDLAADLATGKSPGPVLAGGTGSFVRALTCVPFGPHRGHKD